MTNGCPTQSQNITLNRWIDNKWHQSVSGTNIENKSDEECKKVMKDLSTGLCKGGEPIYHFNPGWKDGDKLYLRGEVPLK